ncbi:hypothetical protein ABPG72_005242 [Tetrahymena utriculariae]
MSGLDLNQLRLILQHIEQQDANGKTIKYSATKEFKKLLSQNNQQINSQMTSICYEIIANPKERLHSRLYSLKFVTSCLLEGNIVFIETFQDHEIMDYFAEVAQESTFGFDSNTFGTMFLNSNNPNQVEQQNSQNFVRMLLECCVILSQVYPVRQNIQKAVSKFRQLIDTLKQGECFVPTDRKIQTQDISIIQNALIDQNYIGSSQNGLSQEEYYQNINTMNQASTTQQGLQGSKAPINKSQINKGGTPQPSLTESMAAKIKGLNINDYNQLYKENLKLLEQIRQSCIQHLDYDQQIDQFLKKLTDVKKMFDNCNVRDDEIENKAAMISIVDQEVIDCLQQYKKTKNADNLVNYFLVQYEQTYTGFLGEALPNQQAPSTGQIKGQSQKKIDEQKMKEQQLEEQRLEQEQRELEQLQNERNQQMLEMKEKERQRLEEEEAKWNQQKLLQEQQEQEKQQQLKKQKEQEMQRQLEQEKQQQLLKKKQEEEIQRQHEKQIELERQKEIERQKEQERQHQMLMKQKEEELEKQRQLQIQQEKEKQIKLQQQQQSSMIKNPQQQSQIKSNYMNNENINDEEEDDGIYRGVPNQGNSNPGFKNSNNYNIYKSHHNKMPSVIEEEVEDIEKSNKNSSQIKQDMNGPSKRYHSQLNQSAQKSSFEMRNSKFQAALNQMADQERSKLRESRLSVRSNYELEKSSSMSRFDPNKSKPVISKGVSRDEHKAAINKEKEEKVKLEKVIFGKEAEINSQKDAMKLMTKEMIELKTVNDHLEKDILKYQQKIQLYESGNVREGDKYIEKINILENEINTLKADLSLSDDKYRMLHEQKQQLEIQIAELQNELKEIKEKNSKLERELDSEKMKQSKLEERVTERLSNTQSQLEKEISFITVEKTQLEGKMRKMNEDHIKLTQQYSNLSEEHKHVKNDFANYRQQSDLIQSGIDKQNSKSSKQLEEQEAIIKDLRKQTQKLSDENKKLFDQNKLVQQEIEIKEQQIDTLNDKILSLENDRLSFNQEMKTEIKTTNENHKYIEMRTKWQDEKNLHLENLNKFKKDMKQLQDIKDQLQTQLIEAQRQVNELQNQLVQQNNNHSEEMAKLLKEKQQQSAQQQKQQMEKGEYEEIINQIQRDLLQKNKLIEELQLDSEKQIREEKAKVSALTVKVQQLEQANQEIIPDNKQSESEISKLKLLVDQHQDDLKKQIKLNQEQNELLFNIHKELAQEKKNFDEYREKNNILNDQIVKAGLQISQYEHEIQEQNKQCAQLKEQNHNLTQQVKDLQDKLEQAKQPDKQLLDQIEELQQINTQLHARIDQLMLEASKMQQYQDQQIPFQEQEVGGMQMAKTQPKKFNAQKPQEIIIQQDVDNMATNSMLSDARRINDCLDDQNGKENKQVSAFKYDSEQRQNMHQQQNQLKLSEMGKRGQQYISPQSREVKNRPLSYDKFNSQNNHQTTIQNKVSPRYFEAQDNFETIPVNFAQDMRQIDPESAALIFPFQNPIQYYENKAPKVIKGKLVRNDYNLFSYLPNNPQVMYRFKRGCLKENFPLFQNEEIQIGLISRLMVNDRADILEIILYFTNRTEDIISDLQVYYNPGKTNTLELEPQELDTEILPGVQKSQRLLIGINEIPFEIIQLDFSYRCKHQNRRYTLAIPNTINKFFEPKVIDISTFKYLWGNSKDQMYRSEEIYLEEKVAKSSYDFLNYFKNFMEINEAKQQDYLLGLNETKVGGCFQLRASNTRFLMKVSIGPNGQAVFQVCLIDQPVDELQNCVLEHIIQTFSLIFRSDQ